MILVKLTYCFAAQLAARGGSYICCSLYGVSYHTAISEQCHATVLSVTLSRIQLYVSRQTSREAIRTKCGGFKESPNPHDLQTKGPVNREGRRSYRLLGPET